MKWDKKGQIFKFKDSPFSERFVSHAKSPQALVFDDFIRVYFSTRKSDQPDQFTSYVQYVDFNMGMDEVINCSDHEVISPSELGCFDEHGIFPISPTRINNKICAYTSGWSRRKSVSVETGIGLVISKDNGKTFSRIGMGPVLGASLYEPFLVVDGFVRYFLGKYYMFYIYGKEWVTDGKNNTAERVYKIGYAISNNGIDWTPKNSRQIIPDKLGSTEAQALHNVIEYNGKYHMYFCYREAFDFRSNISHSYKIGYAYSKDLKKWNRVDHNSGIDIGLSGEWDSEMMCYPHVFRCKDEVYLLYNGNQFGKDGFGLAKLENKQSK